MNFEWFFSKKTVWKDCSKNKYLRSIVIITQITIIFGLIITILTFSIGFGLKKIVKNKLFNIKGQIFVQKKDSIVPLNIKEINFLKKNFFHLNYIEKIYKIAENNVIINTNKKTDRYIYKGLYKDYNPLFFKFFLIKGNIFNIKKKLFSNQSVLLSKKISLSLGLNIGSNVKIYFFFFKNNKKPIILSKKFKISGLYETGIPEFDNVYIIGNIKFIPHIYYQKKFFSEKLEIFLSPSFYKEKNIKIYKKKPNDFSVQIFYDKNYHSIVEWINIFHVNIIVISFIVFLALIINMIVFIIILLLERIKTIGILKTLGAKNKVIQKIFLLYVLQIFIPSLIIGNGIAITILVIQKKFHLISLNKIQYFVDYVPVYFNINHIFMINFSIIFICFVSIFFPSFFIINKTSPIKVIEFE
ncbi:ABC transporter permease [Blattabacterium cuenoti]|uniref:ABC transporter permease n=1 Tax=Blattabacterium cuenoti TaxID=1653831 RepID=UPI00163BE82E|nr:FtsX-like permease family protein [Blattabacterium cuenoti]